MFGYFGVGANLNRKSLVSSTYNGREKTKNHTTPCSDEELFFAKRDEGDRAKNLVVHVPAFFPGILYSGKKKVYTTTVETLLFFFFWV